MTNSVITIPTSIKTRLLDLSNIHVEFQQYIILTKQKNIRIFPLLRIYN